MWRDELSIDELEMIAENELIEIVPNFKREEIQLISGPVGPFKPNKPIKVTKFSKFLTNHITFIILLFPLIIIKLY